jgi:indole-3-glycerol phosphate synthase
VADALQRIYAAKADALEAEQREQSYEALRERALARKSERRSFLEALRGARGAAIVAEIKRASPSAGLIARSFDPVATARMYEGAGADAISVLTERDHFLGELEHLDVVRSATGLPILRKDFLWTRYQVAQSAAYGADCILLIVAGLDDAALHECMDEAQIFGLDVLVETHDRVELERALATGTKLVGINNRSLRTLVTDLAISEHLLPQVGQDVFAISESGVRTPEDIARLRECGAQGFLVGEVLMRSDGPRALLSSLRTAASAPLRGAAASR